MKAICSVLVALVLIVDKAQLKYYPPAVCAVAYGYQSNFVTLDLVLFNKSHIGFNLNVLRALPELKTKVEVSVLHLNQETTNLFDISHRFCNVTQIARRNILVRYFKAMVLQMSNVTMNCPVRPSMYHLHYTEAVAKRILPMQLFYNPKTILAVSFLFFEPKLFSEGPILSLDIRLYIKEHA